jgi:uncharacterized protein
VTLEEDSVSPEEPVGGWGAFVPVASLRKQIGSAKHFVREGRIPSLGAIGVSVPDTEPIVCDLELSSYPAGIMVTGTVTARWNGECRRCGGEVSGVVEAAVRERFVASPDDAEDDSYPLDSDQLDLEPLVRDAVLLELPLAPLCSPDCQGLCPACGENRNVVSCGCQPEVDPRWAPLEALRGRGDGGLA